MFSKSFGSGSANTGFNSFGSTQASANAFAQSDAANKQIGTSGSFGNSQGVYGHRQGTSLFSGRPAQTNLFQSSSNPAFGALGNGQAGFGLSNLFGQQQQQQSVGGVFGSNAFGQQNKTNLFGTGTSQQDKGLFGQQQLNLQGPSTFHSTSNFNQISPFVRSAPVQPGTAMKFNHISGTDTIQKGGIATTINTKYHSITCMKEYENKSFEELRIEDYLVNRKGIQQENGLKTSTYSTSVSSGSLFGQASNKTAFQPTSTFSQFNSGFGIQNNKNNSDSLFRQTGTGFATRGPECISEFGNDTTVKSKLVGTQQVKPFGDTISPFQQSSGFSPGMFSQSSKLPTSGTLFKNPLQLGTAQSQGFTFSKPNVAPATLQPDKTGFNIFGQNSTVIPNYNKAITFGQQQSPFDTNTAGKGFGTFSGIGATGFGTSLNVSANPQQTLPSALFAQPELKPQSLDLGGNTTASRFYAPQPSTTNMAPLQQSIMSLPTSDSAETVLLIANSQFPFSPHLAGLTPVTKSDSTDYPPNRLVTAAFWDPKERITNASPKLKVTPIFKPKKSSLFDSPEDSQLYENYFKKNEKRLIIKKQVKDDSIFHDSDEEILERIKAFHENNEVKEQVEETIEQPEKDSAVTGVKHTVSVTSQNEDAEEIIAPTKQDNDVLASNEILTKHHPCGIILERPEYFTIPPLDQIEEFKNEDGTCLIQGFTIGRIGYGSVYFPDIMDVSDLNLDEIVFFRYKEVTVYPDSYPNKPPVGKGLNREAQVTLDHVYPEMHGRKITDLEELLSIGYIEKLKDSCLRQGCKFLEYRVESGSWVFKVKHFTTYGDINN